MENMDSLKVVYTIWTKPHLEKCSNFGFNSLDDFKNSVILSVNAVKQYYDNVHLYIDSPGMEILKDVLHELPFKEIHNVLDEIYWVPSFYWAFPKLYVYGLQEEPFIHIDNDAILFSPINDEIINNWDCICQWFEDYDREEYKDYFLGMDYFKDKGIINKSVFNVYEYRLAANAGIFGAMNEKGLEMFKWLSKEATLTLERLEKNKHEYSNMYRDSMLGNYLPQYINMLTEQSLSWVYMKDNDLKTFSIGLNAYMDNEYGHKFSHLMGNAKKDYAKMEKIAKRVQWKIWTA